MGRAITILVSVLLFFSTSLALAGNDKFRPCHDFGNNGASPIGAPTYYKLKKDSRGNVWIKPIQRRADNGNNLFKLIVEDVRFTNYKCWDRNKNLTGFDIELMAEAAHEAGYQYIEFVPRPWRTYTIGDKEYLSLLIDLVTEWGDALSAGMSITPERLSVVNMVGPIYKAGKKLMARKDNRHIDEEKLGRMLQVPGDGFEALRGLSVIAQGSSIRGQFFRLLNEQHPGLVEYIVPNSSDVLPPNNPEKLQVYEIDDFAVINNFIDGLMTASVSGKIFDLVMIDTGSTLSLIEEGKLGVETQVVTGNLGAAPVLGDVFGLGDGVSFKKENEELFNKFQSIIAKMIRCDRIDQLVEKWFADDNAADHSWADRQP